MHIFVQKSEELCNIYLFQNQTFQSPPVFYLMMLLYCVKMNKKAHKDRSIRPDPCGEK